MRHGPKKIDKSLGCIRFELNLTKVPSSIRWIYSSFTIHISNTMQDSLTIETLNQNENFIFMGNEVQVPLVFIGTFYLILDIDHH